MKDRETVLWHVSQKENDYGVSNATTMVVA